MCKHVHANELWPPWPDGRLSRFYLYLQGGMPFVRTSDMQVLYRLVFCFKCGGHLNEGNYTSTPRIVVVCVRPVSMSDFISRSTLYPGWSVIQGISLVRNTCSLRAQYTVDPHQAST